MSGKTEPRDSPEPEKHPLHRHEEIMSHVIDLPCEVAPSKAKATFNDGRLDIVMPKVVLAKSAQGRWILGCPEKTTYVPEEAGIDKIPNRCIRLLVSDDGSLI